MRRRYAAVRTRYFSYETRPCAAEPRQCEAPLVLRGGENSVFFSGYTGPATGCLDVDVTCFRDDATIVGPLTTPNDGAFSFNLPYGIQGGIYGARVACTDGTCVDATRRLVVAPTDGDE